MRISVSYKDMADRGNLVKENEAKGLRMLHDNFDKDWLRGDEPRGILVFTNEPGKEAPHVEVRDLEAEIDELRAEIGELRKPDA